MGSTVFQPRCPSLDSGTTVTPNLEESVVDGESHANALQGPGVSWGSGMACLFRLALMNWMRSVGPPPKDGKLPVLRLIELAGQIGLTGKYMHFDWDGVMATRLTSPVIALLNNSNLVLVLGPGRAGAAEVAIWDPLNREGGVFFVTREAFEEAWSGDAVLIYPRTGSTRLQTPNWSEHAWAVTAVLPANNII